MIIGPDGILTLRVVAPPVEGKANREVVRFLAKRLGRTKSQVRIIAGLRSNIKIVEITNMNKAEVSRMIAATPP